jgi:hypothetical protein
MDAQVKKELLSGDEEEYEEGMLDISLKVENDPNDSYSEKVESGPMHQDDQKEQKYAENVQEETPPEWDTKDKVGNSRNPKELFFTLFCSLNHSLCNLVCTNLSLYCSLLRRDLNIVSDLIFTNLSLEFMFKWLLGAA